jgi:hypothetical protein
MWYDARYVQMGRVEVLNWIRNKELWNKRKGEY